MSKFEFPNNPGVDRPNPFEGTDGKNLFGDEFQTADARLGTVDGNPYTAESQEGVQPYQPGGYETFLPHRGRLVFRMGATSCWVQAVGVIITGLAILLGGFIEGFVYSLPAPLFGLALSVPAWLLGHGDWAAIEAGAMDSEGKRSTRLGLWCGIVGTFVGGLHLVFMIATLFYSVVYV